jgi:hypothetical protein
VSVHFTIDRAVRLVAYVVDGTATEDEAREFLDSVLAHPDFETGFNFLGDRRGVTAVPDATYIYAVAVEVNRHHADLAPCQWAVIVSSDVAYGMTRMWGLLTADSGVKIIPFRTAEVATAWLGLSPRYAPLLLVPAA